MIGTWDTMIPEGEIISLLCTILTRLEVGEFTVKVRTFLVIFVNEIHVPEIDQ